MLEGPGACTSNGGGHSRHQAYKGAVIWGTRGIAYGSGGQGLGKTFS